MKCKIQLRIAEDKKRGRTPSDVAIDFIRRTCPCEACVDWRKARQAAAPARL